MLCQPSPTIRNSKIAASAYLVLTVTKDSSNFFLQRPLKSSLQEISGLEDDVGKNRDVIVAVIPQTKT